MLKSKNSDKDIIEAEVGILESISQRGDNDNYFCDSITFSAISIPDDDRTHELLTIEDEEEVKLVADFLIKIRKDRVRI